MADLAERLTNAEREQRWKNQRPKDAATVIMLDRSEDEPRVLMGRRHDRHVFLPGMYVFPGGRVDRTDGYIPAAAELEPAVQSRLLTAMKQGKSAHRTRALALAAIREVFEETGIAIGKPHEGKPPKTTDWSDFFSHGLAPDLSVLRFVARAITPPRRPRRFDTRFFAIDMTETGHSTDALMRPSEELEKLVWMPVSKTSELELPTITSVVLEELSTRLADDPGLSRDIPVPYYHWVRGRFIRETV